MSTRSCFALLVVASLASTAFGADTRRREAAPRAHRRLHADGSLAPVARAEP